MAFYSRSRRALLWASLAILAVAVVAALAIGQRAPGGEGSFRDRIMLRFYEGAEEGAVRLEQLAAVALAELEAMVDNRKTTPWDALATMPTLAGMLQPESWPEVRAIVEPRHGSAVAELAVEFLGASFGEDPSAMARLRAKADEEPPVRYANRILAELALRENDVADAAALYAREGAFADAEEERRKAIELYQDLGAYRKLAGLRADPRYEAAMGPLVKIDLAARDRDWVNVAKYQLQNAIDRIDLSYTALALIGGAVWAVILYQLGQLSRRGLGAVALCIAAVILGAVSTLPAVFLDLVLVELYDLETKGELLHDVAVYIASVGFREELSKLVLFLPLVPFLLRRRDELEMLMVAGFVGLGFAIEENTFYFEATQAVAGPARLLTANFFHIGMTGLTGLYLCRWLSRSAYSFSDFFYVFGVVVIAHGAYNALLSVPQLGDLSLFAYTVFIVLSLRFFSEAHALREPSNPTFSITATFAVGVAVFVSSILVFLSWQVGLKEAVMQIAPSILGVGIIAFMFFREFQDELYE